MKKLFTSIFLVLALLAMTAGTAFAQETTPITGTVQSVVFETDAATGETIVVVTLLDETGASQTLKINLETAQTLGLVTTDPATGESAVAVDAVGKAVEIDSAIVIVDGEEEKEHPVGSALSDFFSGLLGVDYETIMTIHEDGIGDDGHGVGFGVIAQALWLTNQISGGTEEFEALLEAKQTGNYEDILLADGSTPDNWGDVVKSLKKGDNLGSVMSGKAESNPATTVNGQENSSNGNGNGNGNNGIGGSNGNGGGNGNGNGGGNGNGNGGGRP